MLLVNCKLVQFLTGAPARGKDMRALEVLDQAMVFIGGDKIVGMGEADFVADHPITKSAKNKSVIDCGGRIVLPGLVDSHTHPVFAEPRLVDFERRLAGKDYEE